MLKRLIIAVFALALVIGLSSTAISDVNKGPLNPVVKINPENPRFDQLNDARPEQPSFKKPASALRKVEAGLSVPGTPLEYFCDVQDYTNGSPAYYWTIPDAYGDDLFNMRFTADANFNCTLKVSHLLMYGTAMVGSPDMRVYLWDDDGFGFPGNKLDSIDVLNAALPAAGAGYASVDWSLSPNAPAGGWVFSDGEDYHVGWNILQNDPGDVLAILSDDATGPFAGEERASENYAGIWGTMFNDWGLDVSFFILNERCCGEIPYTSCYWQYYEANLAYIWAAPHPTYGDEAYSQRFTVAGPETLQVADIAIYDAGGGTFGNDDVIITIYGNDNATGLPDPANVIDEVTLPAGTYSAYPAWTSVPFGTVIDETFHIAFSSSATVDYEYCLSDDGSAGVGGSASDWGGGNWVGMLGGWGIDVNFVFDAYLCRDEYSQCSVQACNEGLAYFWHLPDAYGDVAHAQKFSAVGAECRIQEVALALYDNGDPDIYTTNSKVCVWSNAGGLPGTELASVTLTPADYVLFPGMQVVPFDVYVSGDYWVGIEALGSDPATGILTLSDAGGGSCLDSWAEDWGGGWWNLMTVGWGVGPDWAMVISAEHCCIPYTGRVCDPPGTPFVNDPTWNGNYARTGASYVEVSDSWCDLTLDWNFTHPTSGIAFTQPVIYDGRLVCVFSDEYKVFNLDDGTELYTFDPQVDYPPGEIRCAPTVTTITGYPDPVMFLTGGDNHEVFAVDFNAGTTIWSHSIGETPTWGYGKTQWGVFTVLNIGGADYVFWGTNSGNVVGADALTGAMAPGFPVDLTQSTWLSGATDGSQLFYATRAAGVEGDIYSIDPATGDINWQLSTSGELQAQYVYTHTNGYFGDEGFTAGVSYGAQNNLLYANSRVEADHPSDGLFYRINAADGSLAGPATVSNRGYFSLPVVDINRVYQPCLTRWMQPPAGGNMLAINKYTGNIDWANPGGMGAGRYYNSAILSCEPEPAPDQLFAINENGVLQCINAETGEEVWRRRTFELAGAPGMGVALGLYNSEPVLATTDWWGNLAVLKKGADRPRLELQTYSPTAAIEFGGAASFPVSIPDVFKNNGCADLNFTGVTADTDPFGTDGLAFSTSNVDGDFMDRATNIANSLAREAYLSKYLRVSNTIDENVSPRDVTMDRMTNNTAAGFPTFINGVTWPVNGSVLTAGEMHSLDIDVIQANINRGPQTFYVQLCTDDPDFFLSDASICPEIFVTLVGGCLLDTTTLHFGMGEANEELVSNTGRIGNGDWGGGAAGHNGFYVDGDGASYYQGSYGWWVPGGPVDGYRIATHTQDWTSGGGEADAFISMQADPNWCDDECKPFMDPSGVNLGYITNDAGASYVPVNGYLVCKSFVDSVQNFDDGYGWDWTNFGAPFDAALSMGLYANGRVVGAVDIAALANVTLEILEITERNGNNVDDWYMGEFYDCDNGGDEIGYDASISTAWTYDAAATQALGHIKVPFGGDHDPIINIWGTCGISGSQGFWDWNQYWDAAYGYVTAGNGAFYDGNMHAGDEEAHVTLAAHDFAPNETYTVGVAHFLKTGLTDASSSAELAPMAKMVNKWAGFGRGDVNNDTFVDLADIIYLAETVNGGNGAVPFQHLSDVNADGNIDAADVVYMIDYYFNYGPSPVGTWAL